MSVERPYKRTDRVASQILSILGQIQTQYIDLSDLEEEYPYTDDTERNLWRRLPMTFPPDLLDEWNEWWNELQGEDDIE